MSERTGLTAVGGNPLTLVGDELKVGDRAPGFELAGNGLESVNSSEFDGKVRIVATVPSLDTGVCDTETRHFNEKASGLGDDVVILTVSMDLPFAQARWCAAAGVERVRTLSAYRSSAFGKSYGVFIKENGLLARAVFVVDREGIIRYVEIVDDLTNEPNYEATLDAARKLL